MPTPDDSIIDQITDAAVPLPDVKPPDSPSLTGRRRPAVDWQRVNSPPVVVRTSLLGWIGFLLTRTMKWMAIIILTPLFCYVAAGIIGAWLPVNSDFQNAADGIEIFIYSGNVHSEFILPLQTADHNWSETFSLASLNEPETGGKTQTQSHVAIGWGDRDFYTKTQQWSDLSLRTALAALFLPTDSVVHVQPVAAPYVSSRSMRVKLTPDQYAALCQSIQSTIADLQPITGASTGDSGLFFAANGKFHLLNTCNNWVGEKMKAAQIKVGRFTPLPRTVFWHLEN